MQVLLTTPAVEYPVTVAEVKAHLRIDATDEDALIQTWIAAATAELENRTRRQFCRASYTAWLDAFPLGDAVELPHAPAIVVTSIQYVDTGGATQTLAPADYALERESNLPSRIRLAYNAVWPATRGQRRAVAIVWQAGYGDAADVPEQAKLAIKLLVGHWYVTREAVGDTVGEKAPAPFAFVALADSLRVEGW